MKQSLVRVTTAGFAILVIAFGLSLLDFGQHVVADNNSGDVFVADQGPGGLIRLNPSTGAQSHVTDLTGYGADVITVGVEADGSVLFGGRAQLIRVNPSTGVPSIVSSDGFFGSGQINVGVVEADGNILVTTGDPTSGGCAFDAACGVIRVNPSTGVQTVVSSGGLFSTPLGMAMEANGSLLIADQGPGGLIRLNPSTGAQSHVTDLTGYGADVITVGVEADGSVLFGGRAQLIRVNPSTGVPSIVSSDGFFGSGQINVGVVEADGNILVTTGDPTSGGCAFDAACGVIRVNPSTGVQTVVSSGGLFSTPLGMATRFASPFSAAIQPPIASNGSSIFNKNRGTVPVKFTITDNGSPTCHLPPATISLIRTAGAAPGPVNESVYIQPPDDGSNFRVSGCQYTYSLGTQSLGPGQYLIQIRIAGSIVGSATLGLR